MIFQQYRGQANFEIGIKFTSILFWQIFKNILPKSNFFFFLQKLETNSQYWQTRLIFISHKTRFCAEVGNPPIYKIKGSGCRQEGWLHRLKSSVVSISFCRQIVRWRLTSSTIIVSFRIVSCYHIGLLVFLGFGASEAAFLNILLTFTNPSSLLLLMEEFYIALK